MKWKKEIIKTLSDNIYEKESVNMHLWSLFVPVTLFMLESVLLLQYNFSKNLERYTVFPEISLALVVLKKLLIIFFPVIAEIFHYRQL